MPKMSAEDYHADELQEVLAEHGFAHLRVRRRGDLLTIESGPKGGDAFPHARLRRETVHLWRLEMPTWSGEWEMTPIRDQIDNLVKLLTSMLPWSLAIVELSNPQDRADSRADGAAFAAPPSRSSAKPIEHGPFSVQKRTKPTKRRRR